MRDNPRRTIDSIVAYHLPDRLVASFTPAVGADPQTRGAHLSAKTFNGWIQALKGWPLGGVRSVLLERGEVVAGDVSLEEVDPHTMASRLVKGLHLCGEILDLAGPIGGYNLQAAWSTAT